MAEVKLSQKSYDELLKDIEILKNKENKFNEIIAELRNENTDLKVNSEVYYNTCKDWIKNYDELINDIADIKRKAEAFDEIKRTLNKKIPKLKVLTEEYKLKWQREGSSWVLTDYYKQIGGLEQLTQVINFIEELERGSDE